MEREHQETDPQAAAWPYWRAGSLSANPAIGSGSDVGPVLHSLPTLARWIAYMRAYLNGLELIPEQRGSGAVAASPNFKKIAPDDNCGQSVSSSAKGQIPAITNRVGMRAYCLICTGVKSAHENLGKAADAFSELREGSRSGTFDEF